MKKIRNDLILIGCIILIAVILLIGIYSCGKKDNLVAYVYHNNEVVLTIDLSTLEEETIYYVEGDVDTVVIIASNKGIRISEAGCKDNVCVNQGMINNSAQTITCLPNRIVIRLEGKEGVDVQIWKV